MFGFDNESPMSALPIYHSVISTQAGVSLQ